MEEASCRKHLEGLPGGNIMRRHHGGEIVEKESWRKTLGRGLREEESWRRTLGRGIMEEES